MSDFRYLNNQEKFLEYAYDVLKIYFTHRDAFDDFYNNISDINDKNLFLKIISFYKFLVKDSSHISLVQDEKNNGKLTTKTISYIDETYKYIAIFSLIEGLTEGDDYEEFHRWAHKNHDFKNKPINSKTQFDNLRSDYLKKYGSTNRAIKFFKNLDEDTKKYLRSKMTIPRKMKPETAGEADIEIIANFLYKIRSEFVHKCRIILETCNGKIISTIGGEIAVTELNLNDLQLIFEHGFLVQFGYSFKK